MSSDDSDALLSVQGLVKHYPIEEGLLRREIGRVRAVDGVDFDVRRGETLGLVGESGCGKSTAVRTALGLEAPTDGQVRFDGGDVDTFSRAEHTRFRRRIGVVFQDPTSSFDPRMTIGESVGEPMRAHGLTDDDRRETRTASLLELVGLAPEDRERYPHELSGGQKQRAALARALSLDPDLLVLDEPVSALDVSVQASILSLIGDLRDAFDLSVLLISHDMSVVRHLCDRVAVMYLGEIVERAPTDALFDDPKHPYTRALLGSIPEPDPRDRTGGQVLSGDVPDPASPPSGCRFHTRCPAVVPPDDVDLPEETWRSVYRLLADLREGQTGLADGLTPDRVRTAYELPAELPDETVDRALQNALAAIEDDDHETAIGHLSSHVSSICDRESPAPRESGERAVACHRYRSDGALQELPVE